MALQLADQLGKLGRELPRLGQEWSRFLADPVGYKYIDPADPNYDDKLQQLDSGQANDPKFDPKKKLQKQTPYSPSGLYGDQGVLYEIHFHAEDNGRIIFANSVAYVYAPWRPYAPAGTPTPAGVTNLVSGGTNLVVVIESASVYGGAPYSPPSTPDPFDFEPGILIVPGLNDQPSNQRVDERQLEPLQQPAKNPFGLPDPSPLEQPFPEPNLDPINNPFPLIVPNPTDYPDPSLSPSTQTDPSPAPANFRAPPTTRTRLPSPAQEVRPDEPVRVKPTTNKQDGTLNPFPPVIISPPPTPPGCEDPCIQALHDKIASTTLVVEVFESCNDDGTVNTMPKIISVPKSEKDSYELVYKRLLALESLQCDPCNCVAAVPDWWQVRAGADRPQGVLVYANLVDGKRGRSRWSLVIPHYNPIFNHSGLVFPSYTKGSFFATLTLLDNSKLTINAGTQQTAETVISQLIPFINPDKLPAVTTDIDIHTGRRKGKALSVVDVVPVALHYFATGQRNMMPTWVLDL